MATYCHLSTGIEKLDQIASAVPVLREEAIMLQERIMLAALEGRPLSVGAENSVSILETIAVQFMYERAYDRLPIAYGRASCLLERFAPIEICLFEGRLENAFDLLVGLHAAFDRALAPA